VKSSLAFVYQDTNGYHEDSTAIRHESAFISFRLGFLSAFCSQHCIGVNLAIIQIFFSRRYDIKTDIPKKWLTDVVFNLFWSVFYLSVYKSRFNILLLFCHFLWLFHGITNDILKMKRIFPLIIIPLHRRGVFIGKCCVFLACFWIQDAWLVSHIFFVFSSVGKGVELWHLLRAVAGRILLGRRTDEKDDETFILLT